MKKNRWFSVIFLILFLTFIGIMDYPYLARIYNNYVQGSIALGYEQSVNAKKEEELEEERQKAAAYNQELAAQGQFLPDAFQAASERGDTYRDLLNPEGNGIMGVIEIPQLSLVLPICHGTSEEVLQKGAGHLEGSSLPVGGADTHTCISAHRGLPDKELFTNLDQMEEGDCFLLRVLGEVLCYQVISIETVEPADTESLNIIPGKDLATLITCTPYGLNTHRLYLHGKRIPYEEADGKGDILGRRDILQLLRAYWWMPATFILLGWMGYLLYRINRRDKKGRTVKRQKINRMEE